LDDWSFSPGIKRLACGVDDSRSSSAEVKETVEQYFCSPSGPPWPKLGKLPPDVNGKMKSVRHKFLGRTLGNKKIRETANIGSVSWLTVASFFNYQ
jgi:hypothetical protein